MTNSNLSPSSDSAPNRDRSTERSVIQERLRQARLGFNAALVLTVTSGITSLASVALLLLGKVPEGTFATSNGLASIVVSVRCLKLAKDANDRLDRMARDLDED